MSRAILHLLLSLAILLNGVGAARASMPIAVAPAVELAHATSHAMHQASPPCHDAGDIQTPSGPAGDAATDCCQSGACACDCISHLQLVLVYPVLIEPGLAHATSTRSMSLGRPAPALLHLIRPPIA